MAVGYVLISATPGQEQKVLDALREIPQITELHPLFGEYDLIAKVEARDFDALGAIVVGRIRSVAGVSATKTLAGARL